ncbi:hypothetical protein GEV33_006287 [Tenebrio molitor]|uniref:Uncharacterized protein n=1 Tax=Tenebrio molitor TaxID=7067 RepID=A0A8J6LBZ5_TENMO|nr:hypothetical protein GEV33_006287 [Tenebrio molitor]
METVDDVRVLFGRPMRGKYHKGPPRGTDPRYKIVLPAGRRTSETTICLPIKRSGRPPNHTVLCVTDVRGSQFMCGTKRGGKPIGLAGALPRERTLSGNVYTLTGRTWGTDPRALREIYNGAIRPVLLYGAGVWGERSSDPRIQRYLRTAQRKVLFAERPHPAEPERKWEELAKDDTPRTWFWTDASRKEENTTVGIVRNEAGQRGMDINFVTDSRVVLDMLTKRRRGTEHAIHKELKRIEDEGSTVKLWWSSDQHKGIAEADKIAKKTREKPEEFLEERITHGIMTVDMRPKPTSKGWNHKAVCLLAGHSPFRGYLRRFHLSETTAYHRGVRRRREEGSQGGIEKTAGGHRGRGAFLFPVNRQIKDEEVRYCNKFAEETKMEEKHGPEKRTTRKAMKTGEIRKNFIYYLYEWRRMNGRR